MNYGISGSPFTLPAMPCLPLLYHCSIEKTGRKEEENTTLPVMIPQKGYFHDMICKPRNPETERKLDTKEEKA
jgi:hypothetical protein